MSQEQLAQKAGMDRSYVGQVERGENSVSMVALAAIAAALETSVASLMANANL
jgi:transcriptional regulator with XRE-family HTH domain